MFLRGQPQVVARFQEYLAQHSRINFSIITYYEIVSGLKHRDAQKQLSSFLDFATHNTIVPLTRDSVDIAAEIYADLRSKGMPLDDIDILIGGTAITNNMTLVTHNRKHFDRIDGLEVVDWSES